MEAPFDKTLREMLQDPKKNKELTIILKGSKNKKIKFKNVIYKIIQIG